MQLVTGCNAGYLPRMMGYLESLKTHADFPVNFIGVGFEPPFLPGVTRGLRLDGLQNAGAPNETQCVQHGSFLHVVESKPSEVLLYTDGDMVMQRGLDDSERELLALKNNQVLTSWNGGAHETLTLEATRLGMRCSMDDLIRDWGEVVKTYSIYNVGFLAMTRQTWRMVYTTYMLDWDRVSATFGHMARQQWLISYVIQSLGLDVKIAPWSLHAHGHFGLKPGMYYGQGGLWADGKLALFRHHA
jgi:hypothetical protein